LNQSFLVFVPTFPLVMGVILLRFPTENEEADFKSLLLDRQFRFNPKCKLIAPLSEEYWKEFVVSDGRAFLPIEIDSFNYLDAKLLFDRKPYKAIIGTSFDGFLSPQCEGIKDLEKYLTLALTFR